MKAVAAGTTPYTFKKAMASAPQLVTMSVSLVSRDIVNTKMIQNIIDDNEKNFTNSCGYMGNTLVYHGALLPDCDVTAEDDLLADSSLVLRT